MSDDLTQSQTWTHVLFAAAFGALISLPLLLMPFGEDREISAREQRKLAPIPAFPINAGELEKFPDYFTAYYDDHFGQRNRIIAWANRLKHRLFGKYTTTKVFPGRDGWLFYNIDGSILDRVGYFSPTEDTMSGWRNALDEKARWMKDLGVEYLFVIPPNKASVYTDKLPDSISSVLGQTRLQTFTEFLQRSDYPSENLLDLGPLLVDSKSEEPVFFKTDTHWNDYGAFLAYQATMEKIKRWFPDSPVLRIEDMKSARFDKIGDIARFTMAHEEFSEVAKSIQPARPCEKVPPRVVSEFADTDAYKKSPKRLPTLTGCRNARIKAIVMHDSFGRFIQPFFNESFAEVIYMPSYNVFDMESFIQQIKPDLFIDLRVERNFHLLLNPIPDTEAQG
ncbi:MAG: hypothetical protein AAF353_04925 [Pseudomonadota bacterium]